MSIRLINFQRYYDLAEKSDSYHQQYLAKGNLLKFRLKLLSCTNFQILF